MNERRWTILICIIIILISPITYVLIKNDITRNFSLSMFSSAVISLLLGIPTLLIEKNKNKKNLYQIFNDLYFCIYSLQNDVERYLNSATEAIYPNVYNDISNRINNFNKDLDMIDNNLFICFSKKNNLLNFKNLSNTFKNTLLMSISNLNININSTSINKINNGISNTVYGNEVKKNLLNLNATCKEYINTLDMYIELVFEKKYKDNWTLNKRMLESIRLSNDIKYN